MATFFNRPHIKIGENKFYGEIKFQEGVFNESNDANSYRYDNTSSINYKKKGKKKKVEKKVNKKKQNIFDIIDLEDS
jgi:hypothetical protein